MASLTAFCLVWLRAGATIENMRGAPRGRRFAGPEDGRSGGKPAPGRGVEDGEHDQRTG